jgi:hypothetical protein
MAHHMSHKPYNAGTTTLHTSQGVMPLLRTIFGDGFVSIDDHILDFHITYDRELEISFNSPDYDKYILRNGGSTHHTFSLTKLIPPGYMKINEVYVRNRGSGNATIDILFFARLEPGVTAHPLGL